MKQKRGILALFLILALLFSGCADQEQAPSEETASSSTQTESNQDVEASVTELGVYDGYFEGDATDVEITCLSGTKNCATKAGNTVTFGAISEDTVYAISGRLRGSIVIDVGDEHRFELELQGLSLIGEDTSPLTVKSGDKVTITAKKECQNYIYDERGTISESDGAQKAGAIHAEVDLELSGKGSLVVLSEQNNGVHTKKDLDVKNLTLTVVCADNALKGNDSVELTACVTTLIATAGDAIKTTKSDISSKGNQRGTVRIEGGKHKLFAACDGIDASYNAEVLGSTTELSIYTAQYSDYSSADTAKDTAPSAKGIKAENEVLILGGTISVKAQDDAFHAKNDATLENGKAPLGDLTIKGGSLSIDTDKVALRADGKLFVKDGTLEVTRCAEGLEAERISIAGGSLSIKADDDGINGTAATGNAVSITGGNLSILCQGNGIDANSLTPYEAVSFVGGVTIIRSLSDEHAAINSKKGYSYKGGIVVALSHQNVSTEELTNCQDFSSIGSLKELSLSEDQTLLVDVNGNSVSLQAPRAMSALLLVLGDNTPLLRNS